MDTSRREERTRNKLRKNEPVQNLLSYYDLSLVDEEISPVFGADQQFSLNIYNEDRELTTKVVTPDLGCFSQHLGLAEHHGYDVFKSLDLADSYRNQLLGLALQKGKNELSKYLSDLRPLLMHDRQIYFYCVSPIISVKTEVESGKIVRGTGKRVLCALPMSTEVAVKHGCTKQRIEELAPQVAWLIPMLLVYGRVKNTQQLIAYLDGWLDIVSPQHREQMHTLLVKHTPYFVDKRVTQLLLPKLKNHQ